ncbi:MAG TPA: FGGY-family carbohydrate kinase, partial [Clostridia bacterium]|nr:FGGY-family carbohydrate kinase [Clostridia bacterium]
TAAAFVPLYNVAAEDWEADLHGICDREQLADLYWSDELAGTVTPEAALETGLMPGTRVTAGTADAGAEAFSVGVLRPGDMMVMFGSSVFIIHVVGAPRSDPRLWSGPYLFKGTHCLTAGMSCAGTLTRWFKDALAPELAAKAEAEGLNAYAELAKLCEGIPAGSGGLIVLPYFSGERTPINDPDAKGVIFGLNLLHTRAHLYRACLEGVGYGINQHFEIFDAMGLPPRRVTAVGGGTKNAVWLQAVADICGRPYHLPEVEAGAAYGDALMAALAVGHFKDVDAVRSLLKMRAVVEPDLETHRAYQPFAGRYARLYEATKGLMHEG